MKIKFSAIVSDPGCAVIDCHLDSSCLPAVPFFQYEAKGWRWTAEIDTDEGAICGWNEASPSLVGKQVSLSYKIVGGCTIVGKGVDYSGDVPLFLQKGDSETNLGNYMFLEILDGRIANWRNDRFAEWYGNHQIKKQSKKVYTPNEEGAVMEEGKFSVAVIGGGSAEVFADSVASVCENPSMEVKRGLLASFWRMLGKREDVKENAQETHILMKSGFVIRTTETIEDVLRKLGEAKGVTGETKRVKCTREVVKAINEMSLIVRDAVSCAAGSMTRASLKIGSDFIASSSEVMHRCEKDVSQLEGRIENLELSKVQTNDSLHSLETKVNGSVMSHILSAIQKVDTLDKKVGAWIAANKDLERRLTGWEKLVDEILAKVSVKEDAKEEESETADLATEEKEEAANTQNDSAEAFCLTADLASFPTVVSDTRFAKAGDGKFMLEVTPEEAIRRIRKLQKTRGGTPHVRPFEFAWCVGFSSKVLTKSNLKNLPKGYSVILGAFYGAVKSMLGMSDDVRMCSVNNPEAVVNRMIAEGWFAEAESQDKVAK